MASGPFLNLYIQLLYKIADYVLAKSAPSLYGISVFGLLSAILVSKITVLTLKA